MTEQTQTPKEGAMAVLENIRRYWWLVALVGLLSLGFCAGYRVGQHVQDRECKKILGQPVECVK